MKTQLLRFGMTGAVGYVVDSLVLYLMMALGMGFLRGRLVSFVCAVVVTFLLNRRYTFAGQLQTAGVRPPLWQEFGLYLAAMAFGGLLNLATYWFVVTSVPHFPALFALAVAAGSLVGMVVNFASAKWWVFARWPDRRSFSLPKFNTLTVCCLLIVQAVFWISHLHEADLPGLYMDAVNPDYLAARALNPELPNAVWMQPTIGIPVLGALYHGVQTFYVGLPVFALLGLNMLALRVAQGLFASGILVMTQLVLQRATGSLLLGFAGALSLATELAFIASFRTQFYIVVAGGFWLLLAVYLALGRRVAPAAASSHSIETHAHASTTFRTLPWFLSGICAGLAVYGYFVFLFFLPVFVAMGWWYTRDWRTVFTWLLGFALGMQTYVLGYALAIMSLGGFGPALEWIRSTSDGLDPMSSQLPFTQRLANAWSVLVITLQNAGNELMIFRTAEQGAWAIWKVRLLVLAPLLLAGLGLFHRATRRNDAEPGTHAPGLLANWHLALLPLSFFAVSLVFGDRLWSHHYSSLIPVVYVVLFLAAWQLLRALRISLPRWAGAALVAILVTGNLHQQQSFFERLTTTGGVAYFSNAINRLADDALSMPANIVHVFPEWGFGMPFAFLTGNRSAYESWMGDENLQNLAQAGNTVRVYYWLPETESGYRDLLGKHGFQVGNSGTYLQRDRNIAFYWMEALPPGNPR
ncbi:MAG: GtrA family protein [Pseudomonadota bacterium]|nr:GtrA family protein [Pseudomonadota bacterium]